MKKLILCATMLAATLTSKSQVDTLSVNERLFNAGLEMQKYEYMRKKCFYIEMTGLVISMVGCIPYESKSKVNGVEVKTTEIRQPVIVFGGVVALVGYGLQQIHNTHLNKAAKYLKGNGLVIPLNK